MRSKPSFTLVMLFNKLLLLSSFVLVMADTDHEHRMPHHCNSTISSLSEIEGVLQSPGYPNYYTPGVTCSFTLSGDVDERVQLIFTYFSLPEPSSKEEQLHDSCLHMDYVAVYNMDNSSIRREIDHYCGSTVPLPMMSARSGMQVIFKSRKNQPTTGISPSSYGFAVRFKFVKNFGLLSGKQEKPGSCRFIFSSSVAPNGTIESPNPGGFYPQETSCHYIFYGKRGEVVRLIFKYFDVEGILPCDERSDSDYLEFSNFPSIDRKIPPYCGAIAPTTLQSDASFFRVTFRSNNKFDGTGFSADYQFLDLSRQPYVIKRVVTATGV